MTTNLKFTTTNNAGVPASIEGHKVLTSFPSYPCGPLSFTKGITVKKHYQGCFRVSSGGEIFGQIKKTGRKWTAEIRYSQTDAGIWTTKKEAVEEVVFLISKF